MTILKMQDIAFSYGSNQVLKGVSYSIEEPEIIALVGPNGVGKTTLLNIIAGLLIPDRGRVEICGKSNRNPQIYRDLSYMADSSVLYPYLTGMDHLIFVSKAQELDRSRIREAAGILGIEAFLNRRVGEYSLGMKQQLLFTMSLLNKPKLLLLDEPFNGLDPTTIIRVRQILLRLAEEGTTVLLSSHNLSEVDQMAGKVIFISKGELIEENIRERQDLIYSIYVTEPDVLQKAKLPYGKWNGDVFQLQSSQFPLDTALQQIGKITMILDIEKHIYGSEERYRELYNI